MNTIKKRKIKNIIIISIIGILAAGLIMRLSFEPADYYDALNDQVIKAEKLLKEAKVGNAEGEYSKYIFTDFENTVKVAKKTTKEKKLKHTEIKKVYESFKKDIASFKDADNTECISKEGMDSIIKEKKDFNKKVSLSKDEFIEWNFSWKAIKKSKPLNLQAVKNTFYKKEFKRITKELKVEGEAITFLHNGKLPCTATITVPFQSKLKDVQIILYDEQNHTMKNLIRGEVSDNEISFPINQGGTYFILNVGVDDTEQTAEKLKSILDKNDKTQSGDKETVADSGTNLNTGEGTLSSVGETESYCTVEIRCDTVVDTSKLTNQAVAPYIPSSGTILPATRVKIAKDETAFEVLKRVTREYGIQMEFRNDPLYSGAYIEGINYLYEFDAGGGSGWMYKVNGWFPNYGCSKYYLQPGDTMVWCYTCNIGKDVGDQYYDTHPDANPEYQ